MKTIKKFGTTIEFEDSSSTLPPGKHGIGGAAFTSWFKVNGGSWNYISYFSSGKIIEYLENSSNEADFYKCIHELLTSECNHEWGDWYQLEGDYRDKRQYSCIKCGFTKEEDWD